MKEKHRYRYRDICSWDHIRLQIRNMTSLAAIISQQSWQRCHAIHFEELVQYPLGHSAASVEEFHPLTDELLIPT